MSNRMYRSIQKIVLNEMSHRITDGEERPGLPYRIADWPSYVLDDLAEALAPILNVNRELCCKDAEKQDRLEALRGCL